MFERSPINRFDGSLNFASAFDQFKMQGFAYECVIDEAEKPRNALESLFIAGKDYSNRTFREMDDFSCIFV